MKRGGNGRVDLYRMEKQRGGAVVRERREDMGWEEGGMGAWGRHVPVLLFVTGYGVVEKVFSPDDLRLERLRNSGEVFCDVQEKEDGRLVVGFVRCEYLEAVREKLEHHGAMVAGIRLFTGECPDGRISGMVAEFYAGWKVWKSLVFNDRWAGMVADRLRWLVLGVVLLVCVGNYFAGRYLQAGNENIRRELSVRERRQKDRNDVSQQVRQMMGAFNEVGRCRYGFVADRIASVIPEGVCLKRLEMLPLEKKVEKGKELQWRKGCVVLDGETDRAEEVTCLLTGLGREKSIRQVKLLLLEQDRRSGRFVFRVELQI